MFKIGSFSTNYRRCLKNNSPLRTRTSNQPKIIFPSPRKIGENTTNILKCCFPRYIYTLSNQTKYLKVEN